MCTAGNRRANKRKILVIERKGARVLTLFLRPTLPLLQPPGYPQLRSHKATNGERCMWVRRWLRSPSQGSSGSSGRFTSCLQVTCNQSMVAAHVCFLRYATESWSFVELGVETLSAAKLGSLPPPVILSTCKAAHSALPSRVHQASQDECLPPPATMRRPSPLATTKRYPPMPANTLCCFSTSLFHMTVMSKALRLVR